MRVVGWSPDKKAANQRRETEERKPKKGNQRKETKEGKPKNGEKQTTTVQKEK